MRSPRRPFVASILAALFAVAGLAAIGVGLYGAARWVAFALHAKTASGEVVRIEERVERRALVYIPVFRFRAAPDGHMVEARATGSRNSWARYAPGDQVWLRYVPEDPSRAEADPLPALILPPLIAVPLGGLFLALAGGMLWARTERAHVSSVTPRRLGWLAIGSGVALAVMVAAMLLYNSVVAALAELRATEVVTGTVLAHREAMRSEGPGRPVTTRYAPVITFTTKAGRTVKYESIGYAATPRPPLGAAVPMRYRRADPTCAAPDSLIAIWWGPAAIGLALPVVLLGGGALLRWYARGARPGDAVSPTPRSPRPR